jgi:hypothetical protein
MRGLFIARDGHGAIGPKSRKTPVGAGGGILKNTEDFLIFLAEGPELSTDALA